MDGGVVVGGAREDDGVELLEAHRGRTGLVAA
jgi:hypothetical protein